MRQEARKALKNIRTGKEYKPGLIVFGNPFDVKQCDEITLKAIDENRDKKLYRSSAEEQIKLLSYSSEIVGIGADDEAEQLAADPDAIIEVRADNSKIFRTPVKQEPGVALRVDEGWLAGSSRGEWGGELVYIEDGQKAVLILKENIEDIYKLGDQYIATTGLAHMGFNRGTIYEIFRTGKGWSHRPWRTLPWAPLVPG